MEADVRIQNSDGGSFDAATGHKILANSRGFVGEYRSSYCSVSASPIAQEEEGGMQRDYWYSTARTLAKLESPESVGKEAARRTLRRLNGGRACPRRASPWCFRRRWRGRWSATYFRSGEWRQHLSRSFVLRRASWANRLPRVQ